MGTMGTYLFIPFMVLLVGFFVFLFYQVTRSDAQTTRNQGDETEQPAEDPAKKTESKLG